MIAVILVLLLALSGTAFAILRIKFEGPDLADNIASILNKRMRGRIAIGSIEWDSVSLKKAFTGGWVPLRIKDVRVWDDCVLSTISKSSEDVRTTDPNLDCTPDDKPDPDPGSKRTPRKLLVHAELIELELDIHALMFGKHDFALRNVHIRDTLSLIHI